MLGALRKENTQGDDGDDEIAVGKAFLVY